MFDLPDGCLLAGKACPTWLANANKRKHIRVINGRLGLSTPEIVTPLELFNEENES